MSLFKNAAIALLLVAIAHCYNADHKQHFFHKNNNNDHSNKEAPMNDDQLSALQMHSGHGNHKDYSNDADSNHGHNHKDSNNTLLDMQASKHRQKREIEKKCHKGVNVEPGKLPSGQGVNCGDLDAALTGNPAACFTFWNGTSLEFGCNIIVASDKTLPERCVNTTGCQPMPNYKGAKDGIMCCCRTSNCNGYFTNEFADKTTTTSTMMTTITANSTDDVASELEASTTSTSSSNVAATTESCSNNDTTLIAISVLFGVLFLAAIIGILVIIFFFWKPHIKKQEVTDVDGWLATGSKFLTHGVFFSAQRVVNWAIHFKHDLDDEMWQEERAKEEGINPLALRLICKANCGQEPIV